MPIITFSHCGDKEKKEERGEWISFYGGRVHSGDLVSDSALSGLHLQFTQGDPLPQPHMSSQRTKQKKECFLCHPHLLLLLCTPPSSQVCVCLCGRKRRQYLGSAAEQSLTVGLNSLANHLDVINSCLAVAKDAGREGLQRLCGEQRDGEIERHHMARTER